MAQPLNGMMYLRWKVANNLHGRWEVYRLDNSWPWYVGASASLDDAWAILVSDRRYWRSRPDVIEIRGPQTYAQPGIWN
jgi:hypothetical protein